MSRKGQGNTEKTRKGLYERRGCAPKPKHSLPSGDRRQKSFNRPFTPAFAVILAYEESYILIYGTDRCDTELLHEYLSHIRR